MKALLKLFLVRERRQARKDQDWTRVSLIDDVLVDQDLLDLLVEGVQAELDYDRPEAAAPGDFFQWLVDHRDQILTLAQIIVSLLAVLQPAPVQEEVK